METEELEQVQTLLARCIDEYKWMWGVTKKFIYVSTGKVYQTNELKKIYSAMHADDRRKN